MLDRLAVPFVAMVAVFALACGGDDGDGNPGADAATSADAASSDGGGMACPRDPAPADRTRYGVIGRPNNDDASQRNDWEVFELTAAGELTATGNLFVMGRAPFGRIAFTAFTADGEIGIVAQDDGTLGVFSLDGSGNATVIHAAFDGSFYAGDVVIAPDSQSAYVIDTNTRDNGGGIYEVAIGCDGTLTEIGLRAPARSPAAIALLSPTRWLVAARDIADSPMDLDLHIVDASTQDATWVAGVQLFPEAGQLVTSVAVSGDGGYVAVGDNSPFSGVPQRVAIASLSGDTLTAVQTITPVADPFDVVASPFDNNMLVLSGDGGNAMFEAVFDGGQPATPYSLTELTYVGSPPALPANAVRIDRGSLRGRVLFAENVAIRQVQFGDGVAAADLGVFAAGSGIGAIVGAIGVQP